MEILKLMELITEFIGKKLAKGIPLVCLHTAGSDGRQYRALLNDENIIKKIPSYSF